MKNSIWNSISGFFYNDDNRKNDFCTYLAKNFRKSRADEVPRAKFITGCNQELDNWLSQYYFSLSCHELYDLVEFLVEQTRFPHSTDSAIKQKEDSFNQMFESERSGYRLIGGKISRITDPLEHEAVATCLDQLNEANMFGAKKHIETAQQLFSKRPTPDYRNSIEESISVVESIAKILGTKDVTKVGGGISPALMVLSDKVKLHEALKLAFEKLYGFTSDEDGIRHCMIEDPSVGFDEARYMLVSCAAFCTYLLGKVRSVIEIAKPCCYTSVYTVTQGDK